MSKCSKYSPEFKREAVELTQTVGITTRADCQGTGHRCEMAYGSYLTPALEMTMVL